MTKTLTGHVSPETIRISELASAEAYERALPFGRDRDHRRFLLVPARSWEDAHAYHRGCVARAEADYGPAMAAAHNFDDYLHCRRLPGFWRAEAHVALAALAGWASR